MSEKIESKKCVKLIRGENKKERNKRRKIKKMKKKRNVSSCILSSDGQLIRRTTLFFLYTVDV